MGRQACVPSEESDPRMRLLNLGREGSDKAAQVDQSFW